MTGNRPRSILLTDRDRALFQALGDARLLDREQIQSLLNFGSITRANDRLHRLCAAGFLLRHFLGTRAGGRKAIYSLSSRGADCIQLGKLWKLQRAKDELLVGEPLVEHLLAVNWCWIWMRIGTDCGLVRFVRFNQPILPAIPLIPDGYAELGKSAIQSVFLEVDLGTESSRVWGTKTTQYLNLAVSGQFSQMFHQQRFKVAVVCTSERRLQSLRRAVRTRTTKLFFFSLLSNIKRDGFMGAHWLRPEGDSSGSIV